MKYVCILVVFGLFGANLSFAQLPESNIIISDPLPVDETLLPQNLSVKTDKSIYHLGQTITVTGKATDTSPQNWIQINTSNLRIIDLAGTVLEKISPNQNIQIATSIKNINTINQPFVYIIQIEDNKGEIKSTRWFSGELVPGQSFEPSLSWIPEESGIYFGKILVWDTLEGMKPISFSITFTLNVGNELKSMQDEKILRVSFEPLTLKVQNSNNGIILVDQIEPSKNQFSINYLSQGKFWKESEKYMVMVHQFQNTASTTFRIASPAEEIIPPNDNQFPKIIYQITPNTVYANKPIQFDARDSYDLDGSIVNYEWYFGDGGFSQSPNPTHTYANPNSENEVLLKVTDNDGAQTPKKIPLPILPPIPTNPTPDPTEPCGPGTELVNGICQKITSKKDPIPPELIIAAVCGTIAVVTGSAIAIKFNGRTTKGQGRKDPVSGEIHVEIRGGLE